MFGNLGITELLLIAVIVIVLFGARRIPEIMKGLGEGIRGFKKGLSGDPENPESKSGKKTE